MKVSKKRNQAITGLKEMPAFIREHIKSVKLRKIVDDNKEIIREKSFEEERYTVPAKTLRSAMRILPTVQFPNALVAWCKRCNIWHIHSLGAGPRAVHCAGKRTSNSKTEQEYYLDEPFLIIEWDKEG